MDIRIIFLFLIFLLFKDVKPIQNFSLKLIDENIGEGAFVSPVLTENYTFIVAGEDNENNGTYNRYILVYEKKSARLIKKITYESDFGFLFGESYSIDDNSQFLFLFTYDEYSDSASFEIFDANKQLAMQRNDYSIKGFRIPFITFRNANTMYYYLIYSDIGIDRSLIIQKMKLTYSYDYPVLETISYNNINIEVKNKTTISCDKTINGQYILCVYISEDSYYKICAFNSLFSLVLNQELEESTFSINNNFTKIMNLKNDCFAVINSRSSVIMRFRYFRYVSEKIVDKLSPIINNNSTYLDIKSGQHAGNDRDNEMTAIDSDTIIQVTFPGNKKVIYITIIQFYDNDSALSIKIYKLLNDNEIISFSNPRISLLKNSFLICLSGIQNNVRKPGYFILNYPNSTDISLNEYKTDIIVLKDLVKIDNILFSLDLKVKILNIPKDVVLVNNRDFQEIKNGDEFDLNSRLLLKQYKIDEGPNILEYMPIAYGNDSGYIYVDKYPTNKMIDDNEINIEGRHGRIAIDLKSCLNGFYYIENYPNLCIKDKPKNYYLDEINKIYRQCSSSCDECKPPYEYRPMNCINCISNYYMAEDTRSCYDSVIDNYFLEDNKLKKCHENCLQCSSRQNKNCIKCQDNYYKTKDTNSCYDYIPNNYYIDKDNILKRCHPKCYNCIGEPNSETMNCLDCMNDTFFYKNDSYDCILPEEFKHKTNLEITKINNYNFIIFIILFILAVVFASLFWKCYKIKEQKLSAEKKKLNNIDDETVKIAEGSKDAINQSEQT